MARAAMGMLEAQCWTIIFVVMGAVSALIFFLVLGITSVDDKNAGLPEHTAPECPAVTGAQLSTDYNAITPAARAALMQTPCEVDCTSATLGMYWLDKCEAVWTGNYPNVSARIKAETTCAKLGIAKQQNALLVGAGNSDTDSLTAAQCESTSITTAAQAARCATHPDLVLHTLKYMQAGAHVHNYRCSAAAWASIVKLEAASPQDEPCCNEEDAVNYDDTCPSDRVDDYCVFPRVCTATQLNDLLDQIENHVNYEGDNMTYNGSATPQVVANTELQCESGYDADGGYVCTMNPLLVDGVPQPHGNDGYYGTWDGSLTCSPTECSGEVNDQNFCTSESCETGAWECNGVAFGETCPVSNSDCERGYQAAADPVSGGFVRTCGADGDIDGATCEPDSCATTGLYNDNITALPTGNTAINFCAVDKFQTGEQVCMPGRAAVGVLGVTRGATCASTGVPCSAMPSLAIVSTGTALIMSSQKLTTAGIVTTASSHPASAWEAFDNDPGTYWMSGRLIPQTTALDDPDWLQITVPNGIRPCSYSIQLGQSATINSWGLTDAGDADRTAENLQTALARPTAWTVEGDGTAIDNQTNVLVSSWNPPCDDSLYQDPAFVGATITCGPSTFTLDTASDATTAEIKTFKFSFTGDSPAGPQQIIIQDISIMEAYGDLISTAGTKFVAAGGSSDDATSTTLTDCGGTGDTNTGGTLRDCLEACADTNSCGAFQWVQASTTCTTYASYTASTTNSTGAVCYYAPQ
jgi:hypothetical protein